ncbi:hypothetical protein GPL15_01680 [Clostridium sp. MCC353]|uniref:molybdopterin-binding protein n=1 Tax=Clostridium sp. MCC353 TaxID=2592646 RepID=UPI001C030210|nr:molybdopterin-binding protein [Clostridium sp. MCC353]MBT9775217.1 hypothetical protein [Clostridium sp. MCC353]
MDKKEAITDIRDVIFEQITDLAVTSAVSNTREGVIYGVEAAEDMARELGMEAVSNIRDGMFVHANETIMMLRGTPKQTAMAEDRIIGLISKASGVSTAAKRAVDLARGRAEIVCGSFKKMPVELRHSLRHAIGQAGVKTRIAELPFVYLDKNYIRMFGSIEAALDAAKKLEGHTIAVQLRNEQGMLEQETADACAHGASVLMIDTGEKEDIGVVLKTLDRLNMRGKVKTAFAGNVKIEQIPALSESGVDMICIGRDIVDAPVLDLKFDVIHIQKKAEETGLTMNLLEKKELWIENIVIDHVDLGEVARKVAQVLDMETENVLVVDVRPDHITLDILKETVDARQIAGKEKAVLEALKEVDGFTLTGRSVIHSNGVLGLIALEPEDVDEVLDHTYELGNTVREAFEKRVCIFPTGFEVQNGMIKDTNSPYIARVLEEKGYDTVIRPPISDNCDEICKAVQEAMDDGYSLIITTGGVGAEDKDFTVEAVTRLDPYAATPWLVKYQKGTGRHVKEGIRIAAGECGNARIISLPGPNDEVRMAMDVLVSNLDRGFNKYRTAQEIANVLRQKIKGGWKHEYEI